MTLLSTVLNSAAIVTAQVPEPAHTRYTGLQFDIYVARYYLSKLQNAKQRNLEFRLTLTQVRNMLRTKVCPLTKVPMTHAKGEACLATDLTIDRIDAAKGYVPGNVMAMSRRANSVKSYFDEHGYELLHGMSKLIKERMSA